MSPKAHLLRVVAGVRWEAGQYVALAVVHWVALPGRGGPGFVNQVPSAKGATHSVVARRVGGGLHAAVRVLVLDAPRHLCVVGEVLPVWPKSVALRQLNRMKIL